MNKIAELILAVAIIIAIALGMLAVIGDTSVYTWNILKRFVSVMLLILLAGIALIANENKKEKQIDYQIKKMSTM